MIFELRVSVYFVQSVRTFVLPSTSSTIESHQSITHTECVYRLISIGHRHWDSSRRVTVQDSLLGSKWWNWIFRPKARKKESMAVRVFICVNMLITGLFNHQQPTQNHCPHKLQTEPIVASATFCADVEAVEAAQWLLWHSLQQITCHCAEVENACWRQFRRTVQGDSRPLF